MRICCQLLAMSCQLNYTLSFKRNKAYLPFPYIPAPEGMKQVIVAVCAHI